MPTTYVQAPYLAEGHPLIFFFFLILGLWVGKVHERSSTDI